MKTTFLLWTLIGAAWGLQQPLQYHYKYSGRIATGIPGIRAQMSAVGMKADLVIQMKTRNQAIAKLSNIYVGMYNGEVSEDLRSEVPIRYSPLKEKTKELEEPFAVVFTDERGNAMTVPREEEEWITNQRKAILGPLQIEPVRHYLHPSIRSPVNNIKDRIPRAFTLQEDTIFGRCQSEYTFSPLKGFLKQKTEEEVERQLKEDIQSQPSKPSASSTPPIADEYWLMTRAINFDYCNDRVVLTRSEVYNVSMAGSAQEGAAFSRSSVAHYVMRGDAKAMRIQRVVVEGGFLVNPFGYNTDKLQALSNVTLILEKVRNIDESFKVRTDTRVVKTWFYEVASPYAPPEGHPRPWVNYRSKRDKYSPLMREVVLTGMHVMPENIQKLKTDFYNSLSIAADELKKDPSPPSPDARMVDNEVSSGLDRLVLLTRIIRGLPYTDLKDVFNNVFQETDPKGELKQMLLTDIAVASGASSPFKILVEKLEQKEMSTPRALSLFHTITNNLMAPEVVPDLMEYVKKLDIEETPFLATNAYINFAASLSRLCTDHIYYNYTIPEPLFGNRMCNPALVTENFLPYLERKLMSALKSWQRVIYLKAVGNLRVPQVIPILQRAAMGVTDPNPRVRITAIYALLPHIIPWSARPQMMNTLMTIMEDLDDDCEVRQSAFEATFAWKPDASWWQRMARSTWHEPCEQMAAFVATTIRHVARSTDPRTTTEARFASSALPLMKPFFPSRSYSYSGLWASDNPHKRLSAIMDLGNIIANSRRFPHETFYSADPVFGDLSFEFLEFAFAADGVKTSKFFRFVQDLFQRHEHSEGQNPTNRQIMEDFKMSQELQTELPEEPTEQGIFVYFRQFSGIQLNYPLNKETLSKEFGLGSSGLLQRLTNGEKLNFIKYWNPLEMEIFVPSETGLPITLTMMMPSVAVTEGAVLLKTASPNPDNKKEWNIALDGNNSVGYKSIVMMEVMAPFVAKTIAAVVDSTKVASFPGEFSLNIKNELGIFNATPAYSLKQNKKIPIFFLQNFPFTMCKDFWPSSDLTNQQVLPVTVRSDHKPDNVVVLPFHHDVTGLKGHTMWAADVPFPLTMGYIYNLLEDPLNVLQLIHSPTTRFYKGAVVIDTRNSETKTISSSLSFEHLYLSERPVKMLEKSPKELNPPNISAEDSPQERETKLKTAFPGTAIATSLALRFLGSRTRKFETLGVVAQMMDGPHYLYRGLVAFLSLPIPPDTTTPLAVCICTRSDSPYITSVADFGQWLNKEMKMNMTGHITYGEDCMADDLAAFKILMKVSEERRSELGNEWSTMTSFDRRDPAVAFRTPAVYDRLSGHLNMMKPLPNALRNATYFLYDTLRNLMSPHAYFTYLEPVNQAGIINITGQRPLSRNSWSFSAHLPTESILADNVWLPFYVDQITPFAGIKTAHGFQGTTVLSSRRPRNCIIKDNQIRTFDSVHYHLEMSRCYTVAVTDRSEHGGLQILVRKTSEGTTESQVSLESKQTIIEISHSKVKVNDEELSVDHNPAAVKDSRNNTVATVLKRGGQIVLDMANKITLTASADEVEITGMSEERGRLRGLCGDMDEDKRYDMTGPSECLYTNGTLFGRSWTVEGGAGCNPEYYQNQIRPVVAYQQRCIRRASRSYIPEDSIASDNRCFQYLYKIIGFEDILCVTVRPQPFCRMTCTVVQLKEEKESFKCWQKSQAPKAVQANAAKGFIEYPVKEPAKEMRSINIRVPAECRRRKP